MVELNNLLNLGQVSSERLAAQVVLYKTLGLQKDLALICMAELSRRRGLGEDFDFETFIEQEIKKIPPIPELNLEDSYKKVNQFGKLTIDMLK